jgi:hypothetical protein
VKEPIKKPLAIEESQSDDEMELEKELAIAIKEADNGEGRPHAEVWAEIKLRYNL